MKIVRIHPASALQGSLAVPGDKSISHRAVMFAALAKGRSRLRGLLRGEDVMATIRCFKAMGVNIEAAAGETTVEGVGLRGLKAPAEVLDCGNSGTTMRLMMGLLAAQPFTSRLTGDASLNRRPMERVMQPLKAMGAEIQELRASETERVVRIEGRALKAIDYRLPVASAQVKSAILLAGLYAKGNTIVHEPLPSRNHTEIMMGQAGVNLSRKDNKITVEPAEQLRSLDLTVPGDISSAAFFLVAGCLGKGSKIRLQGVGVNPTRTGALEVLDTMGAKINILNRRQAGGEEVADLEVHSGPLQATRIAGALIPRLIDEIPILSVAAAAAEGRTEIRDAAELRVKETDRIESLVQEIAKLSVKLSGLKDGLDINGPTEFRGAVFNSHGDHRIAMSLAIAATRAESASTIEDVACVQTSYPEFFSHLETLGGKVEWVS